MLSFSVKLEGKHMHNGNPLLELLHVENEDDDNHGVKVEEVEFRMTEVYYWGLR